MGAMDRALLAEVRHLVETVSDLAAVLADILDQRERRGRLPSRVTTPASQQCIVALKGVFSSRAVTELADGRVRLDLVRASRAMSERGTGLDDLLYQVLDRAPRDPAAEARACRLALDTALGARAASATSAPARAWLGAERDLASQGLGERSALARDAGDAAIAAAEAGAIVTCIDAALVDRTPIRLANFAARVLGSSKALVPGSDRLRRLGQALLAHDPETAREVFFLDEDASPRAAALRALELHGIVRDEATVAVTCFGPLLYTKGGETFDQVARHAARGEVSALTLPQLREARIPELVANVTVIENQTPFLDYVDAVIKAGAAGRELVILGRGQANWAVVTLLRMMGRTRAKVRYAGDLDRSGVLILRSLARRSAVSLEPLCMDVATHRRFVTRGRALDRDEASRLRVLLATADPREVGHDLLVEIERTGTWIEQEAFHEALIAELEHDPSDRSSPL